jgi:transposase
LEHLTVRADPAGYRQLIGLGRRHDARLWAIEGTGSFGAGLTTALLSCCERIVEVDRPQRPARRGEKRRYRRCTSGPAGARRCGPQRATPPRRPGSHPGAAGHPRAGGHIPDPAISALHALVTSAPDGLRERLRTLPLGQLLHTCAGLRDSARRSVEEAATVLAMRSTARRALACEREAAELEVQLERLVRRLAPELLDQLEIGPVVAGQLISSWSHHGRVRSEAAFAKLGAAPIEASSGTITRHRLNRSGDRQLNRALHTIVLVRMRQDRATKDYVQRRLAQGKTIRDIKRCLKRYIARQLFRQLEALSSPLDET